MTPQKAAGWRIEPPVSVPSASGAMRAATAAAEPARRAAGHALAVPRVAGRLEGAVLGRRAHRELVHVRLADHDRARRLEPRDRGRVEGRAVALEDPRAAGRGQAGDVQHVLHGHRHARERRGAALRSARAASRRRARVERAVGGDEQEGVDPGLHGRDAVEVRPRHLLAGDLAGGDAAADLRGGQPDEAAHPPITRGHAEEPVGRVRGGLEDRSAVEPVAGLVLAEGGGVARVAHGRERPRCRGPAATPPRRGSPRAGGRRDAAPRR